MPLAKRYSILIASAALALALVPAGAVAARTHNGTAKQIRQLTRATKQLQAQVAGLAADNASLKEQNAALSAKQAALEARVASAPALSLTGPAGGALTGNYPNPLIAPNAVGSTQIAPNAVGSTQIAPDAVGSAQIALDAVGASEIATGAVGASEIENGSVGGFDLSPKAVGGIRLDGVVVESVSEDVPPGNAKSLEPQCPSNARLLSGGFNWELHNDPADTILTSRPSIANPTTTWTVVGSVPATSAMNRLFAFAYCLKP